MRRFDRWNPLLIWFIGLTAALAACAPAGGGDADVTTLIYANLTEGGVDRGKVDKFNRTHDRVQIEVRDYFDEDGFSGKQRLLTEIASGHVPDIIDLGRRSAMETMLPYEVLARKGVLEDLWPYIEADPELGRESLLEPPLKAAEVDGGLYVAFHQAAVLTLAGRASVVGDRYSWTLDELQEAFAAMPEDSTILEFFSTKTGVFRELLSTNLDEYVDWETGTCSFDSEKFRSDLAFVNQFPDNFEEPSDMTGDELVAEYLDRIREGRQLLVESFISSAQDVRYTDSLFGRSEKASFVGFPTSGGTAGSCFIVYGNMLAMSSVCRDKEAAWEFIRMIFLPQYGSDAVYKLNPLRERFPINLSDYDRMERYVTGNMTGMSSSRRAGELGSATSRDVERFEDLVNHVERIALGDMALSQIVYDAAAPYFAGDRTLDETVEMIQNRVSLYVDESR